jgi:hypothetical protein
MGGEFRNVNCESEPNNLNNQSPTAAVTEKFRITAGGYDCMPFNMSLGDYVTTNSPVIVEEHPTVGERHFAGGQINPLIPQFVLQNPIDLDESNSKLKQSELYYTTHLYELVAKYNGKFVAIIDNHVVDSDPNLDLLMQRVYETFGYRPILMRRVTKEMERTGRLPTPRSSSIR